MKRFSSIIIAFVLSGSALFLGQCSTAQRSTASEQEIPSNADPALVRKSRELVRQGNLQVVRKNYGEALRLANESIRTLPLFEGYYLKGLALSRSGRESEALEAFEQAEQANPTDQQLLLTSGLLYDSMGQPEKAQQKYLKLTEAYPDEPVYWYRAGVGYKNLRQLDKAYEYLSRSVQSDFEHKDQAYLQLGDVCLELKRYEESEKYFDLAGKANPKMEEAKNGQGASRSAKFMDEGNAKLKKGDVDGAIASFKKAIEMSPQSGAPYFLLGNAYLQKGDYQAALNQTEKGMQLNSDSVSGRVLYSTALRKTGQGLKARSVLEDGLKKNPQQLELINQLGLACRDVGDTKCALVQFEKALKIKPDHYPSRLNAFYTYIDARRYDEAERHLRALEKLDMPAAEKAQAEKYFKLARYLGTGDKYFERNEFYRAVLEYQKALKVDPSSAAALNSLGRTELLRRRFGVAENYYQKALKTDAENVQALEGLLRLYTQTGNAGKRRYIEAKLDQLSKKNPEAAVAFGRIYEDDQQWSKAQAHYEKLLKRYPNHELIRRRLAYVIYRQALEENRNNDPDAALRLLAKSEKLDPNLPGLAGAKEIVLDNKKHARYLPELQQAEEVYQSGRFARAEQLFRSLHAKWPRPAFLVRIADSLIQQGKEDEGFRLLEKAASENPSSVEVREAMFANFIRAGRTDEAKKGFSAIVKGNEDAYYSHYKLGIIQLMNDDLQDAFDSFQTALIYRPDFIPARLARGVALYEQGKASESEKDFKEALQYDTFGKELARLNLALIDLNDNKAAQARKSLEEIARLYPRFSDPHYHLAFLDYEGGNYRGALTQIDRAIDLEKTSEYYLARAKILEKIPGKTAQLQETYRTLLQDFPNLSASDREQVRTKMSRLANGDARALSPLEMPAVDPVRVFRHRDLIIYQEKNRIVAAKIGSERPQYIQTFSGPIMDSNQSYWVYVALRNEVITLDPGTGEIVDRWEIPNVCRLLGDLGDMAVVTGSCGAGKESALKHLGKSAEDRLLSPRDFKAVSPGTFYYAGGFYQAAKTGNAQTMTRINWEGESVKAMLPVTSIIGLERQDSALVLATTDALLVLDPDTLEVDNRTKMAVRSLDKTDNHLFVTSGNELHQWKDGKLSASIRLPAPVRDGQTIHAIGDDRLLYIGTDGALRLLDATGKVLWKENPGKFDSRLLSVYY